MRRLCGDIHDPYRGRARLTPERATCQRGRSEKSAEAVRAASAPAGQHAAKGQTERRVQRP